VAKAILGFANRSPEVAALTCEGAAYMVVGVAPGTVNGVGNFDHATLVQKIKTYVDGPRWAPHYVPFSGVTVLVVVVEAPRDGDSTHTLRKKYDKFHAGFVFHRGPALTEPAGPNEIAMLEERRVRGVRRPELDLDLSVAADPLVRLHVDPEAMDAWLKRREAYIRHTRKPPAPPSVSDITAMFRPMADPNDRSEFERRVKQHLSQSDETLLANVFRSIAVSRLNKVACHVANPTDDPIVGVQLTND